MARRGRSGTARRDFHLHARPSEASSGGGPDATTSSAGEPAAIPRRSRGAVEDTNLLERSPTSNVVRWAALNKELDDEHEARAALNAAPQTHPIIQQFSDLTISDVQARYRHDCS